LTRQAERRPLADVLKRTGAVAGLAGSASKQVVLDVGADIGAGSSRGVGAAARGAVRRHTRAREERLARLKAFPVEKLERFRSEEEELRCRRVGAAASTEQGVAQGTVDRRAAAIAAEDPAIAARGDNGDGPVSRDYGPCGKIDVHKLHRKQCPLRRRCVDVAAAKPFGSKLEPPAALIQANAGWQVRGQRQDPCGCLRPIYLLDSCPTVARALRGVHSASSAPVVAHALPDFNDRRPDQFQHGLLQCLVVGRDDPTQAPAEVVLAETVHRAGHPVWADLLPDPAVWQDSQQAGHVGVGAWAVWDRGAKGDRVAPWGRVVDPAGREPAGSEEVLRAAGQRAHRNELREVAKALAERQSPSVAEHSRRRPVCAGRVWCPHRDLDHRRAQEHHGRGRLRGHRRGGHRHAEHCVLQAVGDRAAPKEKCGIQAADPVCAACRLGAWPELAGIAHGARAGARDMHVPLRLRFVPSVVGDQILHDVRRTGRRRLEGVHLAAALYRIREVAVGLIHRHHAGVFPRLPNHEVVHHDKQASGFRHCEGPVAGERKDRSCRVLCPDAVRDGEHHSLDVLLKRHGGPSEAARRGAVATHPGYAAMPSLAEPLWRGTRAC